MVALQLSESRFKKGIKKINLGGIITLGLSVRSKRQLMQSTDLLLDNYFYR